jgi:PAS domain S-box-containing protein
MKDLADYKLALDESAIVVITDPRGIIIYANDNFCKISKYPREEIIGQDHCKLNSGHHSKAYIQNLWETIIAGKIWRGQMKNKAKDGSPYWVDMTIIPFFHPDGTPREYVAIRNDITPIKESEEAVLQSLKEVSNYKYALDASSIVAIADQKGTIKYVNDNFCQISKYSREELLGKDHRLVNSGYHSKAFIRDLWQTITSGNIWKGEMKNKAKDGTYYWVDTTIVPFLNEERIPFQYLAIRSDITDRKQAEEKLLKYTKAVAYKNSQLVDFCNIVSHNLRGPLINISMLADYIEQAEDPKEQIEVLGKIKPVVNHLMEVFNELVESLQVKQDTEIKFDKLNLKTCLEKVLIGFEGQIKESDANIEMGDVDQIHVYCPRKYMESILANLISNALKYKSPKRKPKITIKTETLEDSIVISIKDNGLGINLDLHQKHLFKIRKTFHKHPDAKGFGLFMTKTHVEAIGGKIWVKSTPDKGSTFYVELNNQNR